MKRDIRNYIEGYEEYQWNKINCQRMNRIIYIHQTLKRS